MIGPIDIKRIVICTGCRDLALSRYVGARLSRELPAMDIHVYYQGGKPSSVQSGRSNEQESFNLKQVYWKVRARWKRWGTGFYRWRYFKRCHRQVEKQLHDSTPQVSSNLRVRSVISVNDHVDEIRSLKPDLILIAGGGKVHADVLEIPSLAINIHSGKLPQYRGVRSALFALSNNEPEKIGVTLHVAEAAMDAGDTIKWLLVNPAEAVSMSQLWFTLYETGVSIAIDTIRKLLHSSITMYSQTGTIHHYKMRDIDATMIRSAYRNFRNLPRQQTKPTVEACSQPA